VGGLFLFGVLERPGGAYLQLLGDKKVQLMLATLAGHAGCLRRAHPGKSVALSAARTELSRV